MDLYKIRTLLTFGKSQNGVIVIKPREDDRHKLEKGKYIEIPYSEGREILRLTFLGGDMFHVVRYRVTNGQREEFSRTPHPITPVDDVLNLSVGGVYKVSPYNLEDKTKEGPVELTCLRKPIY